MSQPYNQNTSSFSKHFHFRGFSVRAAINGRIKSPHVWLGEDWGALLPFFVLLATACCAVSSRSNYDHVRRSCSQYELLAHKCTVLVTLLQLRRLSFSPVQGYVAVNRRSFVTAVTSWNHVSTYACCMHKGKLLSGRYTPRVSTTSTTY